MACPDLQQLEQYLSNDDDDASRCAVAQHVAVCGECSSRLSVLEANRRIETTLRELLGASSATSEAELPSEIGSYRLLRELGRGGMGVVYEAEQQNPPRRVAVKVLRAAGSRHGGQAGFRVPATAGNGGAERLLRHEARALGRLRHASIASIYEAGQMPDGRAFFAMELVEGESLTAYAQHRQLTLRQRLELFAAVCDAVAYAHQRGVIHRDLKPSNVLIEPDGTPKVLDFGLARILEADGADAGSAASAFVEMGRVFGTLPYMSPEHLRGDPQEIEVRSDVYSLGVMLYELLTGRLPYPIDRSNVAQVVRVICEQPAPPPSADAGPGIRSGSLRGEIDAIVLKALEKQLERRYPSAGEFAQDIRRHLKNEPIAARPPSAIYQLRKFTARNKALVASIAISAAALLVATGAAFSQAVAATRERDAAERRLEWARHSADYLFFGLNGQIARVPGTGHILRHLAEEAYVFYRRIADEDPDNPAQQEGLWAAMRTLAVLALQDGQLERARLLADDVHARVQAAATRNPDDPFVMRELMQVHQVLASVATTQGDAAAAEAHRARAFELCRQVAEWYGQHTDFNDPAVWEVPDQGPRAGRQPEHSVARGNWARALVATGDRALAAGDAEAAEQPYRDALHILDELTKHDRTLDPLYRRDTSEYAPLAGPILLRVGSRAGYETTRAGIFLGLGNVALRRGDLKEAEQQFRAAVEIVQQLGIATTDAPVPEDVTIDGAFVSVHTQMAHFWQRAGDLAAARSSALEALAAARRLADADPKHHGWQQQLATASALVAELHSRLAR